MTFSYLKKGALAAVLAGALSASALAADDLNTLIDAAKKEGAINSVGMPDTWANWKDTWDQLEQKYGLKHTDTDMSSAQEIAKFAAEKKNATADIGDVGASFGPLAVKKGVTMAYKTRYWDQIPAWAKDQEGHWMLAYTGTIAFIVNKNRVKDIPRSWAALKTGQYKVTVGDVSAAAQAVNGVLAANFALGGDERDLSPALAFFAELAKQGRLGVSDPSIANLEKGEVEVAVVWDFNGLNYRDQIDPNRFEVLIPSDGSITSGYSTIINKYAKHPNAAKLAREYILSDEGQINLARGYARPIRADFINLPEDVVKKLLPSAQYQNARPIQDAQAWEKSAKQLPRQWQEMVIINMK
ncbi:extracellular solute-binding protein [Pasteurellaceae bacterium 20609_3]|uniref:ABC transporter substrate-binding protein n=1 Tax=Spirabiliibacterium mucosae TaxID=28156 RepID=UPI001AAD5243|nr:ABC transporter substrate-binding protein [Spirabiliibacterium mucosae]MBE2898741.1 extracellular solute-binding protein [Spirabiliibacterium mucosae]